MIFFIKKLDGQKKLFQDTFCRVTEDAQWD